MVQNIANIKRVEVQPDSVKTVETVEEKPLWTIEQQANMLALIKKMDGLGIDAKVSSIEAGPVVTGYFFELDAGESINRVIKKSEDFALALKVDSVVVQRVKGHLVIFVPNKTRSFINYKDILWWYMKDENVQKAYLPIALGVDFHGDKSFVDLVDCPHVMLCGSTGSGKSVFESSIISNFAYKYSPSELHMYLVDSKMLDLPLFGGLPHVKMMAKNLEDYNTMMFGIMFEIRRRMTVLSGASCRNIQDYHRLQGEVTSMPYIVVLIDELADLIDTDSNERKADKEKYEGIPTVKGYIKQFTQIARAAGVHMIAGTQRASV